MGQEKTCEIELICQELIYLWSWIDKINKYSWNNRIRVDTWLENLNFASALAKIYWTCIILYPVRQQGHVISYTIKVL